VLGNCGVNGQVVGARSPAMTWLDRRFGKGAKGKEAWELACCHFSLEGWWAGNTERMYCLCCHWKGKIGGIEFIERCCHGKGGNVEKQRRNGRVQGTKLSQAVYV